MDEARSLLDSDSLSFSCSEAITSGLIEQGIVPSSQGEMLTNDITKLILTYINAGVSKDNLFAIPSGEGEGGCASAAVRSWRVSQDEVR